MHLARLESTKIFNALFDELPGLRLDPDAPPPYVTGTMFRSPPRLDVVWDWGHAMTRVIQWATGVTGMMSLRHVIGRPDLDLVGVRVYDPARRRRRLAVWTR